jgi:retron-type reverse transcriptase
LVSLRVFQSSHGDERVIRLIIRMLKSGILEDRMVQISEEEGTSQGSILSPLPQRLSVLASYVRFGDANNTEREKW